ncbi:MAG TPA: NAD(+)/NADH kinase [Baekduia sp.]|uniref:NAD(+)/NADH kinase n=1 Tax=Baekduia sp. TaxID=2600305 RepID=UPI002B5E7F47|nr:NAD(+)/NADH kinase [Baekduia sp.]HMJ33575.1 NAD(+)/NADH kinase [Baekduia sp.]
MNLPSRLNRIGLVVHPHRPLDRALKTMEEWAATHDVDLVQVPVDGQERSVAPPGDPATCDLIIAVGGDGTTLAALHAGAAAEKPVLGVACGSLGALTAVAAANIEEALRDVAAGNWRPQVLPGVAVAADGGAPQVAINDLVVVRKGAGQVVIGIEVDDELYVRFAGDGVVIATPQGSSAYTLAAGGPVLAPGCGGYVLTPLAPHGGCCPPLVVGQDTRVAVTIEPSHVGARLEFDGQIEDVEPHRLDVSWRDEHVTLVQFGGAESLLAGLRRRRIIIDSPRVLARDDRFAPPAIE